MTSFLSATCLFSVACEFYSSFNLFSDSPSSIVIMLVVLGGIFVLHIAAIILLLVATIDNVSQSISYVLKVLCSTTSGVVRE